MQDSVIDQQHLLNQIKLEFGLDLEISKIIANQITVSRSAIMTVFLTPDEGLYAFIGVKNRAVLADIMKMLTMSGLVAEQFLPPAGKGNYFHEIGLEQFKQVYPGRQLVNDQDLAFYKTLAPYNPALVRIKQVKNGRINTFDADVKGNWRLYCKFYYNKININ